MAQRSGGSEAAQWPPIRPGGLNHHQRDVLNPGTEPPQTPARWPSASAPWTPPRGPLPACLHDGRPPLLSRRPNTPASSSSSPQRPAATTLAHQRTSSSQDPPTPQRWGRAGATPTAPVGPRGVSDEPAIGQRPQLYRRGTISSPSPQQHLTESAQPGQDIGLQPMLSSTS
jgi:hypothetical protein